MKCDWLRPSDKLPGEFSGKIGNVKSMNAYPLRTITYSRKRDAEGYRNGVEMIFTLNK